MKFYPKTKKSSLAYYLKECEFDNKLDMPFHHMFKYYRRALKETNATMAKQMHEVAEYGVAAHWMYKNGLATNSTDGTQFRWIRELLEILENASNAEEFLENTKLEMYYDQVFCFTPSGELIALPKGATPVDFAFAIHSNVGLSCIGARINGRIAPLKMQLEK